MPSHRIAARLPRGERRLPVPRTGDDTAAFLRDAAATPDGHTPAVVFPASEAEVAETLRTAPAVLPIGAQSSLTGGATPFGEWVMSLVRLDHVGPVTGGRVRAGAGVSLIALEQALSARGLFFPPVPTFRGALVGGVCATNAAGAATFKYGSTRAWVHGLTVVLADGGVLDLERGACRAHPEGFFEIAGLDGAARRVRVPTYRMPAVVKRSAGYHAEPGMDLVDLFVGSEGTLGVIVEAELRVVAEPGRAIVWAGFPDEGSAVRAAGALRAASGAARSARDLRGVDVAAIESLDRRSLALLREDGADREHGLPVDPAWAAVLLIQAELPAAIDAARAQEDLGRWDEPGGADTALGRLVRLLAAHGGAEGLRFALPGERRRAESLMALREAVPLAVNRRVAAAQRERGPGVRKTAGDMVVPFERVPEMLAAERRAFEARGLDHAIWGHLSDGNLHPNVIPRTVEEVRRGEEALLELADTCLALGGCPLAEHGVGRNPLKQAMLARVYRARGLAEMRAVKAALDPEDRLAPGVLLPR